MLNDENFIVRYEQIILMNKSLNKKIDTLYEQL